MLGAIVLGAGQWMVKLINDWVSRTKRRLGRRLRVVVVVDHKRSSRRRRCFWKYVLKSSNHDLRHRVKCKFLSIADELSRGQNPATTLFSLESTDIIVINWDAVNGDPVYGSDRAYHFMRHYGPDMLEWLSQGGLLFVESQGASWSSSSDSYACFTSMFQGSEVSLCSEMWTVGNAVSVDPSAPSNPLTTDLGDLELTPGGLWARKPWFPSRLLRSDIQSLRFARRHQQLLYRGWFDEWTSDWSPILVPKIREGPPGEPEKVNSPEQRSRAVALYRPVHRSKEPGRPTPDTGHVVLTTMFVASAELTGLISNFLALADDSRAEL